MEILFEGKAKTPTFLGWNKQLFDQLLAVRHPGIVLLVNRPPQRLRTSFEFHHRRSKRSATLQKEKSSLILRCYATPDTTDDDQIVPTITLLQQLSFSSTTESVSCLGRAIIDHLCVKNTYYHGTQQKRILHPMPSPQHPFSGGRIVDIVSDSESTTYLTDTGLEKTIFGPIHPKSQIGSFLIMSNTGGYTVARYSDLVDFFDVER